MSENTLGAFMEEELVSQPEVWQKAVDQAAAEQLLPADGTRIAVIGCGTSWFMAQSYAAARESAGKGRHGCVRRFRGLPEQQQCRSPVRRRCGHHPLRHHH